MAARSLLSRTATRALSIRAMSSMSTVTTQTTRPFPRASTAAIAAIAAVSATAAFTAPQKAHASSPGNDEPSKEEIAAAASAISDLLDNDESDIGPTLVRLAWHASGTYDKETNTGGSDGATMRFQPESGHGANAGLHVARSALEPIYKLFPNMT